MGGRRWSPDELRALRVAFPRPDTEVAHIAAALGRSAQQVRQQANRLGLQRPLGRRRGAAWRHRHDGLGGCSCRHNTGRHWSGRAVDDLERLYGTMPTAELAQRLGRTPEAVYQKAATLGLTGRRRDEEAAA